MSSLFRITSLVIAGIFILLFALFLLARGYLWFNTQYGYLFFGKAHEYYLIEKSIPKVPQSVGWTIGTRECPFLGNHCYAQITYATSLDSKEVVNFYHNELPKSGWKLASEQLQCIPEVVCDYFFVFNHTVQPFTMQIHHRFLKDKHGNQLTQNVLSTIEISQGIVDR